MSENPKFHPSRRSFLLASGRLAAAGWVAAAGGWVLKPSWANAAGPIRVGIAADISGALSTFGNTHWQAAQFAAKQINDAGGILGRPLELYLEDTVSDPGKSVGNINRLLSSHELDLVMGGGLSSTREALKVPVIQRAKKLYIYPQHYEGGDCTPHLYTTAATVSHQLAFLIPYLIKNKGAKRFALPGANYQWPQMTNALARKVIEDNGGEVVFEEYYPLDQVEYSATVGKIMSEKIDHVFNTIIPPGIQGFMKQLYEAGFAKNGGTQSVLYFDENAVNSVPERALEGVYNALDFFHTVDDPYSQQLIKEYNAMFPGSPYLFTAGVSATGSYRGLKFYEQAVLKTNGDLAFEAITEAYSTATLEKGPGGGAKMNPDTHAPTMNIYLAQAGGGKWNILDKKEAVPPGACRAS
ncbi:ABC transporter substrate-binding protein [Mesorhizobium sp. CO1-1-8]|uniref:ABC transporter substrate-binding protein n=1 Tax=Mesorhizobium sp. CO1-1-8 TaxID=2876631 RepID=UPI001CD1316B|nr:ABC transporter substrate-binding protein [Mesorhizobium sp. CO1-1-8]MBZ9772470.1 ABC transporter substrate-binding protein [Mesorhizobium sp. CO1-1-8]